MARELSFFADEAQVSLAREEYAREGRIEIPEYALTSPSPLGTWVQAWVWLPKQDKR